MRFIGKEGGDEVYNTLCMNPVYMTQLGRHSDGVWKTVLQKA